MSPTKDSPKRGQHRKTTGPQAQLYNLLRQGTEALQTGQTAKAVRLLEQAHRLDPEDADVALNLGGAYILSKRFTKAVSILEPLSERDPHNPMVWTNLGAAYLGNPVLARDEDQRRAIAAFETALDLNPVTPHVAYNLGLIYRDRDETDQALFWFRRALQTNPDDSDALSLIQKLSQGNED